MDGGLHEQLRQVVTPDVDFLCVNPGRSCFGQAKISPGFCGLLPKLRRPLPGMSGQLHDWHALANGSL
jgi:hypothetical protein